MHTQTHATSFLMVLKSDSVPLNIEIFYNLYPLFLFFSSQSKQILNKWWALLLKLTIYAFDPKVKDDLKAVLSFSWRRKQFSGVSHRAVDLISLIFFQKLILPSFAEYQSQIGGILRMERDRSAMLKLCRTKV